MFFALFIIISLISVTMAFKIMLIARTQVNSRRLMSSIKSVKVGDSVPQVIFKSRVRDNSLVDSSNPFVWKDVSTNDLFAKKRVAIFALPGGKNSNNNS